MSFGYVGEEYSRLLGKSVGEMVKHQLNAALVDFQEIGRKGKDIATYLQDEREAAITTGDTRLAFKLKGDISVDDGVVDEDDVANGENMCYMPPGFVSKQVDPSSATGKVRISPSVTRLGLVPESVLEFKEGRLVGYESKSAQARRALKEIIEATPENSRNLSLFTIGVNPKMKYGNAQDRFVQGSVGLAGFGFSCILQNCDFSVGNNFLVKKGRLV